MLLNANELRMCVDFRTRVIAVWMACIMNDDTNKYIYSQRFFSQLINIFVSVAYDHTRVYLHIYSSQHEAHMLSFLLGIFQYFIRLTHENNMLTRICAVYGGLAHIFNVHMFPASWILCPNFEFVISNLPFSKHETFQNNNLQL